MGIKKQEYVIDSFKHKTIHFVQDKHWTEYCKEHEIIDYCGYGLCGKYFILGKLNLSRIHYDKVKKKVCFGFAFMVVIINMVDIVFFILKIIKLYYIN